MHAERYPYYGLTHVLTLTNIGGSLPDKKIYESVLLFKKRQEFWTSFG